MPRISEELRKQVYVEGVVKRLEKLYRHGEAHPDEKPAIEANLDGYFEAGLLVKLVTRDEIQKVIDSEHLRIFGKTREQRKKERDAVLLEEPLNVDWSGYDLPPSVRKV
jgi:hypothetical protein